VVLLYFRIFDLSYMRINHLSRVFALTSIFTTGVVLSACFLFVRVDGNSNQFNSRFFPIPGETTIARKSDIPRIERQKKKADWIEKMHNAIPGTDWRRMDREFRMMRYQNSSKSSRASGSPISVANGAIEGIWKEKGSANQSGRTRYADIDTSNGLVYVGSDGGNIYRGKIDGSEWVNLNDRLQFESINTVRVIHHNSTKRILVGTWSRFTYYSDDEGETWNLSTGINELNLTTRVERLIVCADSARTVYALVRENLSPGNTAIISIWKSDDLGATFSRSTFIPQSTAGNITRNDIWASKYHDSGLFWLSNGSVYKITPDLSDPVLISSIPDNGNQYSVLAGYSFPQGATSLYVYLGGAIYKSADAGLNWTNQGTVPWEPFFKTSFSASEFMPDHIYLGEVDCHYSVNGGTSWFLVNSWVDYYSNVEFRLHADIPSVNSVMQADGSEILLINTDGGLYTSVNNMVNVRNISLFGLNVSQYYSSYTAREDTNFVYIGSQDQGFQRSSIDNGGILSPVQVISGDYGHIVSGNLGASIWMVYPGFAAFYPDATSNIIRTWDFQGNEPYWMPPLMEDPFNENAVLMASGNKIRRLEYLGGNDIQASFLNQTFINATLSALAYSSINPQNWYALSENGRFYRSTNAGDTWASIMISNGPGANYLYGASVWPSTRNENIIFIGGSGYSNPPVYKSVDGGLTFTPMSDGLPSTMVFRIVGTPNDEYLFAATELGPYVFIPTENRWFYLADEAAPDQTYWSVDYIPEMNTARFSTYGRGVWDFKITTPLSVKNAKLNVIWNIFPNPAKESIRIQQPNLSTQTKGTYTVYDVSGKLHLRGNFASNDFLIHVEGLPSGLYFMQFDDTINKRHSTGKFIKN